MEILFPAARCPLAGTPLLQTISLWIFPSRNPLPFRPIRNPLPSLFLNKFSCAISDNYRPTMNIHNDPTLVHEFSVFLVSGGRVCSRKGGVGSREMVLIGSRIANESLKLALVTCRFERRRFCEATGWKTVCALSVVYYCYRFVVLVVVRIENLISLLLSFCAVIRFKGDMKKKSVRALINLRFECISYFRIV